MTTPVVDRYADAVDARRAELRARLDRLDGSHRTELRAVLALSRIATAGLAVHELDGLGREVRAHVDGADRAGRDRLPALLAVALGAVVEHVHRYRAAELRPALRRIAGSRALDVGPAWPSLPEPRTTVAVAVEPETVRGSLLTGAADGLALWRLVLLPLAALPLLGLPALGGLALAPLAAGAGVAGIVVAVRSRRATLQRAALRRGTDEMLAATRSALDADLARWLLELERTAGAELDRAVRRRRAVVCTELQSLATEVSHDRSR